MAGNVITFADLARYAQAQSGPLAPPLKASGPLDAATGAEITQIAVSDVKQRFATGTAPDGQKWRPLKYQRPRGGSQPLRDTGRLMASITGRHTTTEVVVGTNHPGAALQNYGGTVRPVRAKFLAIALSQEAIRAGSPRRFSGKGTKQMPLFARKIGGQMVGHFLLVKQVKATARPFMGLSAQAMDAIASVLAERAAKEWQAAK